MVAMTIIIIIIKTVVDSSSLPQSKLHKRRHLMLSYHYVREALATGEYVYSFVNGKINPSDILILSKHWAHKDVWPLLKLTQGIAILEG